MTSASAKPSRRIAKADPSLGRLGLFDAEINRRLADELPAELCEQRYFTRATMPYHWLGAILENQPSYREREKSVALDFGRVPGPMAVEFIWAVERQVRLGMRIHAEGIRKLTLGISIVTSSPRYLHIASLLDLSREEWVHTIRKERIRRGDAPTDKYMKEIGKTVARLLDILAYVYHPGPWWKLNVWNPLLDTRIPLREHEPMRHNVIYFSHLTTPWLREAAKWWLSRSLERDLYTWSTVHARQHSLVWFQRYLDLRGSDGPHLVDDQRRLSAWVQGFREWLNRQNATTGPRKGQRLGAIQRRAAMTALEQMYRMLFEESETAAQELNEPRWPRLGPQYVALFRFGDKPSGPKAPPPEAVLSDAVITRIAEHSGLLAQPKDEGGFGQEQLVRILGLLIKTGRRICEITMLDFDPLVAVPFPDPNGHVARLRYQQTKVVTDDSTILVDQEVVDIIRRQQDYARAFMAEQGRAGVNPKYLFLADNHNRNGDRHYPQSKVHLHLNAFIQRIDIRDEQGKLVNVAKTHSFRHTRATNLLNAGTPIHVAMRYMGHKTPTMFMHYAQTLSSVAEHEFLRYKKVTAEGRDYDRDPAEMYEALALDKRTDRILPNGYCTLPPRQACDKGNACLSCRKFVTDATFADSLQRQRSETAHLVQQRQDTHTARFGEPMTDDNIWLSGRKQELAALDAILVSIAGVRSADGDIVPLRGAGAPQHRWEPTSEAPPA
jgi:integrase